MMKKTLAVGAAAVAVSLTLAGCASGPDTQNVKTDFGVTASTITLGAISDTSNIYKASAPSIVAGNEIYFADRNKNNKICGREVVIDVKDHASDSAKAATLYSQMQPNILGLVQLLGSPQQAALAKQITSDGVTTMLAGWSSAMLPTAKDPNLKYYVLAGTTYPLDTINGMQWLMDSGKIAKGDTVGYIYATGAFGGDAYNGGKFFAEKAGVTLAQKEVAPNATDLTAQVADIKSKNPKAIVVSGGPAILAGTVSALKAAGLNIPVLANSPAYDAKFTAAANPAAAYFSSNVYLTTSLLPTSDANTDGLKKVQTLFTEAQKSGKYPATVVNDQQLNYGYALASIMGQALDAACKSGDMTRAGLNAALGTLSKVVTGVTVDLDYTNRQKSPSTASYILQPDAAALGGSKLVKNVGTTEIAKQFQNQ